MPYTKIEIHSVNINQRKKQFKQDYPKEAKAVFDFLRQKQLENDISEKRQEKILSGIRSFLKQLNKPLNSITKKDLENYKLKTKDKSEKTMKDYLEIISGLFESQFQDKAKEWDLKKWFKIKTKQTTPEVITEAEAEKLYDYCKNEKEKFIISVLFDCGFRASEFLNLRFEDFQEPTETHPYYKIDLKGEYSKTLGRIVSCFWKHTNKSIKNYLATQSFLNPKAQVITDDYDNIRQWLTRLSKRVLKKKVNLHMLRKSSATFYASKLNRQQLCKRYGWTFSSRVVDVYIDRAGIGEEEITEKITNSNMEKLEKENQELTTKFNLLKENSEKENEEIKSQVRNLLQELQKKYGFEVTKIEE